MTAGPRKGTGRVLHQLFEASLALKGLFAGLEGIAGLGLLLTPGGAILHFVDWLTRAELAEDPQDLMAALVLRLADGMAADAQGFYAVYLLSHGLLKLAMVGALALRVRVAYPLAIVVLAGFVVYQMHRYAVGGGLGLIGLSLLDAAMIWLTWREWRAAPAQEPVR